MTFNPLNLFKRKEKPYSLTEEDAQVVSNWLWGILEDHETQMHSGDVAAIQRVLRQLPYPDLYDNVIEVDFSSQPLTDDDGPKAA